ncbi:aminopeptidase P family protein [halophilic archaeon]|nr:aminopeptidase P family protein [halophilic archaeon]
MLPADQSTPNYEYIVDQLDKRNADAYVHIGDNQDQLLWYLTQFNGPDRDYAFVLTNTETTLCAPALFSEQAEREFPGDTVTTTKNNNRASAAQRSITVLKNTNEISRVLIPDSTSYWVYSELEKAGYTTVTTSNIEKMKMQKSPAEIENIRKTELIAQKAMQYAETILANATILEDKLIWKCKPLTTKRLRREINVKLARNGANDAGNTVIGAGESCADLHFNGEDNIRPDETVLIDLGPRGPSGYFGDITRTFVPGSPPEWEQDVYATVQKALQAGLEQLNDAPSITGSDVHTKIVEVIEANGYKTGDVDVGLYHGTGHGVGTSLHEPPFFSRDTVLEPGHVVTIEPGIYDPDRGGVRLEDLVLITKDGAENLVDYPCSSMPCERSI